MEASQHTRLQNFTLGNFICGNPETSMKRKLIAGEMSYFFFNRWHHSGGFGGSHATPCAAGHLAQLLRVMQQKGTLAYNSDAVFIFLDDSLHAQATFIAGEPVWIDKNSHLIKLIDYYEE